MVVANRDRVGQALEHLREGLYPFVEREMRTAHGARWTEMALQVFKDPLPSARSPEKWDAAALLTIVWEHWTGVFRKALGQNDRNLVGEIRGVRNRWAHQEAFNLDDTNRALDSIKRLLTSICAPQAEAVDRELQEVLRQKFDEMQRRERKKAAQLSLAGQPSHGLLPWREIITPHPDVTKGTYQQAEFAADLAQVHRGDGSDEYKDPREFFRRTYITDGLRHLLRGALLRLSGKGGDPVVELQTSFGGGKTHSMLALYHLFSGAPAAELPGLESILKDAGIGAVPKAKRAVFVGTAKGPAQTHAKGDGTVVHTIWGELAWQLLGKDGYKLVAESDKRGISPGSDLLREVFVRAGPCLVLIDEWVAHMRMLYGVADLPAGSFDANLTFAQALTEAAKAVPSTLVVASLPSSDIEIGGEGGKEALNRLRNTFGRVESTWRPANQQESYEIVRRRLFQPVPAEKAAARDAVAHGFLDLYREQRAEFPNHCGEGDYEQSIRNSYPIHPELFERLYTDWSSLEKFQRTRGVLRLMAAVIHDLWVSEDRNLLILPATAPLDARAVQDELRRYIDDTWGPVIEKDVDGPDSLPLRIDQDNPNLGRYSACRRVSRTLFLGSAATLHTAQKGLDDRHIKLGCAQPGESVAIFGDALRRLKDQATHLYEDGSRYWFSTQPSVNRLARDRAHLVKPTDVLEEIARRLKDEQAQRGDFSKLHVCPADTTDVPDEREVRLVILDPEHLHSAKTPGSPARKKAEEFLAQRGSAPRIFKNTVVFVAADQRRFEEIDSAVRDFEAWNSIVEDIESLNLDAFQSKQARTKRQSADETVKQRIPETYSWLLVPTQIDPKGPVEWQEIRMPVGDRIAVRASKRLNNDNLLLHDWAGTLLRMEIDKIPLWRGDHVQVRQLFDDFAQYLYLQRLTGPDVLARAVKDGASRLSWSSEGFAYADAVDEKTERYVGLRAGEQCDVASSGSGFVVKAEVAAKQRAATGAAAPRAPATTTAGGAGAVSDSTVPPVGSNPPARVIPTRFHGSVRLTPQRIIKQFSDVAENVIQHLQSAKGAVVEITIEIRADVDGGIPDHVHRTVGENCRTLKFDSAEFDTE